jgi:hypothetical protein
VKIVRADARIAIAKAATRDAKIARQSELEETYFKLLIAQRRLTETEWKVQHGDNRRCTSPDPSSWQADRSRN